MNYTLTLIDANTNEIKDLRESGNFEKVMIAFNSLKLKDFDVLIVRKGGHFGMFRSGKALKTNELDMMIRGFLAELAAENVSE